jgi:hypothetical protein
VVQAAGPAARQLRPHAPASLGGHARRDATRGWRQSLAKGAGIKPNVSADSAASSLQYSLEQLVAADKELHRVRPPARRAPR